MAYKIEVTENMVKDWLESNDKFMVTLAKNTIGQEAPLKQQAVQTLKFFTTFAIGCARLGLDALRDVYCKRADLYVLGLYKMGYSKGWRAGKDVWSRRLGTLDRIVTEASFVKVDY